MTERKLDSITDVVKELDSWMQHYIHWYNENPTPEMKERYKACEHARNLLADIVGEA